MKPVIIFLALLIFQLNTFSQNSTNKLLTPADMQYDIEVLRAAFLNLHPGLYKFNRPEEIEEYFTRLRAETSNPLTEKSFFLMLSKFAEKIKCGHTFLNPLNQKEEASQRLFDAKVLPFLFVTAEGKLIVTHNLSGNPEIKAGDEIARINGFSSSQIIDSLLTVSRSDGKNALGKKLNNINITPDEAASLNLFDVYFPLFFGSDPGEQNLGIRHYDRTGITYYSTTPITVKQRAAGYELKFGRLPEYEGTWDYKTLNERTAYMKFGTFAFWNSKFDTKKYIDSIFADLLSKERITNLVIDIRGNEGGDNSGDYVLSYITSKELGCDNPRKRLVRSLAIPDSLLPYLDTWDNSFKKPLDPAKHVKNEIGLYEEIMEDPCETIAPQKNNFKGRVFLLIDAKNSSAGFQMAEMFKTAKLGTIIGETTGGSQIGINGSRFFFLYLPRTGLEIDLPLIYGYHPGKPDSGITPDAEILTTQKNIMQGSDPQLKKALELIAR